MRRVLLIFTTLVVLSTASSAISFQIGQWWLYKPVSGKITDMAQDGCIQADSLMVSIIGKVKISGKNAYVVSYTYTSGKDKFVKVGILDPDNFNVVFYSSIVDVVFSGNARVITLDFPLKVGKRWNATEKENAFVVSKEVVSIASKDVIAYRIRYSGAVEKEVLFSEEIGNYVWMKSKNNELKLENWGFSSPQELMEDLEKDFENMAKSYPLSCMIYLEMLKKYGPNKDFAENLMRKIARGEH